MKNIVVPLLLAVLIFSCERPRYIADADDYDQYMQPGYVRGQTAKIDSEISFWQTRLQNDTGCYVSMQELAGYRLQRYKLLGTIRDLQQGDSLLQRSSAKLGDSDPDILFSLSQNSISRHLFRQAADYNRAAEISQGDRSILRLLQFDACMELGLYTEALKSLESLKNKTTFDYLVRKAKWEDHSGNLDGAIELMEMALEKVRNKNKGFYSWALSNLGDMYGHAGRIRESYNAYLEVLEKDPANLYSLKGIAWIAFAHDYNPQEAKRILQFILSQSCMPDLKLILAEIAESQNQPAERKKWIDEFLADISRPGYGDMYNKYLIQLNAEEMKNHHKALSIARMEIRNRFTPETACWLAWALYKSGNHGEAFRVAKSYVYQFTHEPEALMHTAWIFAANGKKKEAGKMLEECLENSFELGPVATKEIREKLTSLNDQ